MTLRSVLLFSIIATASTAAPNATPPRTIGAVPPLDQISRPDSALTVDGVPRRLVAIDGLGLWPNLTVMPDGTMIASVFNQPHHGWVEGDVECWASTDTGKSWKYRSRPTRHEPFTNRMNCAAGLNGRGELVVLCSGWDQIGPTADRSRSRPLQSTISISRDNAKSWEIFEKGMPAPVPGLSAHVPFGRILRGANGDLVAGTYAFDYAAKRSGSSVRGNLYAIRSHDEGKTWPEVATIVAGTHCEAAMLNLGQGRWISVGRRFGILDLDLFASEDDGLTWHHGLVLGIPGVSSPDLLRLSDGRILLTYGNRCPGNYGIDARLSGDGGKTWSLPQRLCTLDTADNGYPMAAELPGGRVLVAYYSSGIVQHRRYHMGVVNFFLDELVSR